jgi:hypothetical protein
MLSFWRCPDGRKSILNEKGAVLLHAGAEEYSPFLRNESAIEYKLKSCPL